MKLRTKFNLVMLGAFAVGLGLAAAVSYKLAQDNARREVTEKAALMMSQAGAISTYTDREIAPLLAEELKIHFLPQSIPFFAARTNFQQVTQDFPDYTLKVPALDPTNPDDRPADWEAAIIDAFRRDAKLADLVTQRDTPTGPILSYSQPVRVSDPGCLECHSTPAAAPASMVDLYGAQNGFGWKLGDTVGARIVSVPMRVPLERARETFLVALGGLAAVFLVTIALLNLLLHTVIVKPVRRISAIAGEVSLGNMDAPAFAPKGNDEIASLAASFDRMRRSLVEALKLLDR